MEKSTKIILISLFAMAFMLTPFIVSTALAKPPQQAGQNNQNTKTEDLLGNPALENLLPKAGISQREARSLATQYGLTGYSNLPPGIQKNLLRGKPLPPGIARKLVPNNMLGRLPVHPGYEWRVAGASLILVSLASNTVADVLQDVFK